MNITAPFGFSEVVPIEINHRLKVDTVLPDFYATQNAIPVTVGEFPAVLRDLPIVFAPLGDGPEPAAFIPVAVCGISAGDNLLIDAGQWENATYVPAYLRRHPFCYAFGPGQADGTRPSILCVEKRALSDDGEALYDAAGEPSPAWKEAREFIDQVESDFVRTQQFARLMHDLKVLDSFTMTANPPNVGELRVTGMFRVNEDKLKALTADQLRMLIDRGAMRLIYMHLSSIDRFPGLIQRHLARLGAKPS